MSEDSIPDNSAIPSASGKLKRCIRIIKTAREERRDIKRTLYPSFIVMPVCPLIDVNLDRNI